MKISIPIKPTCLLLALSASLSFGDTIELKNGKTLNGDLNGRQAQFVSIIQTVDQSVIERRLAPEEISRIIFSDGQSKEEAIDRFNAGDPYQATILLETLIRTRIPYIELLTESDEALFVMLLDSYINTGRGSDCLDRAKLWRTKLQGPKTLQDIEELQIVAAWRLNRLDEAAFYAKQWIDGQRSAQETAIAWQALAEVAVTEGYTEAALWLALNPIVFSHPNQPRYLADAYEIAIFAAYELDRHAYAKRLLDEMKSRGLAWPIDSERSHILPRLDEISLEDRSDNRAHSSPSSIHSLTIESLSKLVGHP